MRTLNRPMFRIGGSTGSGITSGLAPRQGYAHEPGHVVQNDSRVNTRDLKISDLGNLTIGQMQDLSKSSKDSGDISKFLIDFGLDIASAEPSGSIFSTAAASAKAPYERFQERKTTRAATEADMFSTLFKGAAEAQGEAKAGKGWLEQWKFQQIPILNDKIAEIQKRIASGTLSEDEMAQAERDLRSSEDQLNRLVELDPMTERWINSDEGDRYVQGIREELWIADQQSEDPKYTGAEDPNLGLDALDEARARLKKRKRVATGGRVGYKAAGSVMGDAIQSTPAQTMPEELGNISYEELRSRLPQEVGDEIVRLLANSAEALEDFATIQTEQDISNFNKKYGVNLVLPAEG
jgi:hypothetical protein